MLVCVKGLFEIFRDVVIVKQGRALSKYVMGFENVVGL